jgi:hypothetical protein
VGDLQKVRAFLTVTLVGHQARLVGGCPTVTIGVTSDVSGYPAINIGGFHQQRLVGTRDNVSGRPANS